MSRDKVDRKLLVQFGAVRTLIDSLRLQQIRHRKAYLVYLSHEHNNGNTAGLGMSHRERIWIRCHQVSYGRLRSVRVNQGSS